MARAGEGDPRWIVEERQDSKNVNNWHWAERDVFSRSKIKLEELLRKSSFVDGEVNCKIAKTTFDGVATISVRKGQLRQIFDIEISIECNISAGDKSLGNLKIETTDFSWDSVAEKINFSISNIDGRISSDHLIVIRKNFVEVFATLFKNYTKFILEECSEGLILPTKENTSIKTMPNDIRTLTLPTNTKATSSGDKVVLNLKYDYACPCGVIYDVFTSAEKLMMLTNSPCYLQNKMDGEFSLIDGGMTGKLTKLILDERIEMTWRLKSWPQHHYSQVILDIIPASHGCTLRLTQSNVLAHDLDKVAAGWKRMFLEPIKSMFG